MAEPAPDSSGPLSYPVQPNFIAVRELYIKAHTPPNQRLGINADELIFKSSHTDYDDVRHVIEIGAQVEYGIETKATEAVPYSLRVHIMGQFQIDEAVLGREKIDLWARINAPYILYPFLREHVFSLTARSGFDPLLLPLVLLPTVKVEHKPASAAEPAPV
jgi:preprotein translocase subunit SecB